MSSFFLSNCHCQKKQSGKLGKVNLKKLFFHVPKIVHHVHSYFFFLSDFCRNSHLFPPPTPVTVRGCQFGRWCNEKKVFSPFANMQEEKKDKNRLTSDPFAQDPYACVTQVSVTMSNLVSTTRKTTTTTSSLRSMTWRSTTTYLPTTY